MPKKRDSICVELYVQKHSREEISDNKTKCKVPLATKKDIHIGTEIARARMTITSKSEGIFDHLSLDSTRKIQLTDEQTELEPETSKE